MRSNFFNNILKTAVHGAAVLLFGAGMAAAQSVNLTAGPTAISLPDGSSVPMWGYSCGAAVTGSTATCAASNPNANGGWSPVVITVPLSSISTTGSLTINLTNNLSFTPTGSSTPNTVPTSIMIVGQVGGGLGNVSQRTTTPSPTHSTQNDATWSTVAPASTPFTPPAQGPRVQSFGTEVAAGATASLTWSALRPGTYLIESGTHPSIQGTMGLYGVLVVTQAPTSSGGVETAPGAAYNNVSYDAEVPLIMSEIDPVQNNAVNRAVNTAGFSETAVWSGQPGGCGNPTSATYNTCYPPVVNYTPLYYMINGVAFNRANSTASLFPASPASTLTGGTTPQTLLVRFVNAGVHMHVPTIVGTQTGTTPVGGFALVAEDGNPVPGLPRVQSEVFMAAGKTYDVMVNVPKAGGKALAVYDRELSLSANKINRDAGMLAYVGVNGSTLPSVGSLGPATANPDTYNSVIAGQTFTVSNAGKGVIANDINVYGVKVITPPTQGTVTLNEDGTFTYVANAIWTSPDSFVYCGNGATSGAACATVTLGMATVEAASGIVMNNASYNSNLATMLKVLSPGVLSVDKDLAGYPLTVAASTVSASSGLTLILDAKGGFNASVTGPGVYTFTYKAQNSQGTLSATAATVTLTFPQGSGLQVTVVDGQNKSNVLSDYRWIIEEDKSFFVDPKCAVNPAPAGCLNGASGIVPTFGTNFHTSNMPYVAQGCTGPKSCEAGQTVLGAPSVCDVAGGVCRPDPSGTGQTAVLPSQVVLDPTKRYYISVLPGDAADPFYITTPGIVGHSMGGAPIAAGQTAVTVLAEATPFQPADLSIMVFEDDFPLNGEQDAGGGVDVLAVNEPGLGGFNIQLWDAMGGNGDFTGQMTYDMFNQPLSNSLAGTIDPVSGKNACAITNQDASGSGITGMIVTCPKYETDGKTLSPLAGQAVIKNLMPGRFGVIATPGADRIAKGEEWLQTNTLDGQKAHDAFVRIGEPSYFQEFGPASYHDVIGFANPAIINSRLAGVCKGADPFLPYTGTCTNIITGHVTSVRQSRTPDERLYGSGTWDAYSWTQCYVSIGDPDGEDFAFTKCDDKGNFTFNGIPNGDWRVTVFDKWNDLLVDGLSTPVAATGGTTVNMGEVAMNQWQANVYTKTFIDKNKSGVATAGDPGIPFIPVSVRYRDGSLANNLVTDFNGVANFNETFPLFNWYVVESDTTRYKNTGTHTVYDAGGPADGTSACGQTGYPKCGSSSAYNYLANTNEQTPLPANLSVPGSVYCPAADCSANSILNGPLASAPGVSTGRIDNPWLGGVEGWQGFSSQNNFIEFGKEPYVPGENGGIKGHVVYASTRPFDDPQELVQTQWEPLVPHVTINLYQEGTAADGVTPTLTLVDTTQTSSWDDWAQGFRADGVTPNMNCPGQTTTDLFYFSIYNQPNYLDVYNSQHGGSAPPALPDNSQFKCYDGMHNWNQLEPAPYDGMYKFPSVTATDSNGKPTLAGTNCTICTANTAVAPTDLYYNTPMLPAGKYVVEVVPPPGYELVKEEDKNILIGDNFIAPVTQEFGSMSNIFILPDQASVASQYNANNFQNQTQNLGMTPTNEIVPGFTPEPLWPCVGESRIVPDYISLYPETKQVSPFAGATRNLCDRKEVTLNDQMGAIAKFYIFTSTHIASKFTGIITDDFTSEFDPFSPQFGEKFSPPDLPVSIRDWTGAETNRVYADHWGTYNGLSYSTWEVNPPNPTGYSPTMMVTCMNDRGDAVAPDPLFNPGYSQFCYELPFMPGQTGYFDTPVVPTSAFSAGYNHPDCDYPDATPAIQEVDGGAVGSGPWVSAAGATLTVKALGNDSVNNYGYSGPQATTAPFNQKTVIRHYGFGAQCTTPTAGSATCNTKSSVTIGGISAPITGWSDTTITVTVPSGVPACAVQQQAIYGGSLAQCGQMVITAGNGKQSVDAVTVTIGGKAPTYVTNNAPLTPTSVGAIQQAIDAAAPGDLIMVPPGTYYEMLVMWKPVRLQGVGALSSIIDAKTQPAGKFDPWRAEIQCFFGLAPSGQPLAAASSTCNSAKYAYFNANYSTPDPQIDRLPLEGILGWDTTVNGNLAQLLQEPTLLGAYEGAGITILAKGVNVHGITGYYGGGAEAAFPTGTTVLTSADCLDSTGTANPYPSNFQCNPSSIDGLTITDASQGGGGIFAHAWAHNLQIANDRVYGNIGTLSGGINIGQGESPDIYSAGTAADSDPGSCRNVATDPIGLELPYCFDMNVNVHNNYVVENTSIGDELFSGTPAGAGGVTFCTGADYYKFNNNWVCGNQSTGDGGGLAHLGFIWNGDIEHNSFLFNQSLNPTIATNGGGVIVMGAAPDGFAANGLECGGTVADADCAPGLPDGTGPGLVINANLFQGNAAESGSGGGLRFQSVNGTEVAQFPSDPTKWNTVEVTNNVIVNNVAGWDGAGVSLQDALAVDLINNTIASNDTTATSGVLFNTLGAPLASAPGAPCTANCGTTSPPQAAGLVTMPNSPNLTVALGPVISQITCPANHPNCTGVSFPYLANDLFWQNRTFYIGVGSLSATYQQNIVSMYNSFTGTAPASQTATGSCVAGSSYWDIGVRGDLGPGSHDSKFTLAPVYSALTNASENGNGTNNLLAMSPNVVSQYCNGSRTPPEFGGSGYQVPPGISDATVPNPIFNLTPAATVDEGNNWVNMTWGPLSMNNPVTGATLGNYSLGVGSPDIDYIPPTSPTFTIAPTTDFFGNPRPDPMLNNRIDIGAIEYQGAAPLPTLTTITPYLTSPGRLVVVTMTGTNLADATAIAVSGSGVTVSNLTVVNPTTVTATFTVAANAPIGERNVTITTPVATSKPAIFEVGSPATMTSPAPGSVLTGSSVAFSWTPITGATGYAVLVGTSGPGSQNIHSTGWITTTTATVSGIPTTSSTVYVRLLTNYGGAQLYIDYTYTGAGTALPAALTTPAPGSTLTGSSVTFTWSPATGATGYALLLGTNGVGSQNISSTGWIAATSATVTNLPTTGVTVYARLLWVVGGVQHSADYTYTAF